MGFLRKVPSKRFVNWPVRKVKKWPKDKGAAFVMEKRKNNNRTLCPTREVCIPVNPCTETEWLSWIKIFSWIGKNVIFLHNVWNIILKCQTVDHIFNDFPVCPETSGIFYSTGLYGCRSYL